MNRVDRHHSHSPLSLGQCAGQRNCSSASGLSVPCRRSCLHGAGVKIDAQPAPPTNGVVQQRPQRLWQVPCQPTRPPTQHHWPKEHLHGTHSATGTTAG